MDPVASFTLVDLAFAKLTFEHLEELDRGCPDLAVRCLTSPGLEWVRQRLQQARNYATSYGDHDADGRATFKKDWDALRYAAVCVPPGHAVQTLGVALEEAVALITRGHAEVEALHALTAMFPERFWKRLDAVVLPSEEAEAAVEWAKFGRATVDDLRSRPPEVIYELQPLSEKYSGLDFHCNFAHVALSDEQKQRLWRALFGPAAPALTRKLSCKRKLSVILDESMPSPVTVLLQALPGDVPAYALARVGFWGSRPGLRCRRCTVHRRLQPRAQWAQSAHMDESDVGMMHALFH
jgi:hypothetical protein